MSSSIEHRKSSIAWHHQLYHRRPETDDRKSETSYWNVTAEAIRKPNSVPGTGYPEPGNDHSSRDADRSTPLATYPGTRAGSPQTLLYLVLHRVGFA